MTKRAISLAEFNELNDALKLDLVQKQGAYIGKRKIKRQTVILYQLYGFYVEVYYRSYRAIVDAIQTTDEVIILQPYLDQIHVRDLDKDGKKQQGDL
jgi:hypothetical protein